MFELSKDLLTYWIAAYAALYMVQRPGALLEAIAVGPGLSPASMAYTRKHYKLTYPLFFGLFLLLLVVLIEIKHLNG